jgi:hypothetical protein
MTEDGHAFFNSITATYSQSITRSQLERKQLLEKYAALGRREENKMVLLKKLKWKPRWVSHLGAVEASLKFLKKKVSTAWIYGGSGHAFIINIAKDLCPSGPTAWRTMMLSELAPNLGYRVDGVFSPKANPEFPKQQEKAWNHVKECLDKGIPCYGWELEVPEFYIINGYDDVGYHYSGPGCEDGKGPRPWRELGNTGTKILEVYSVHPIETTNPVKAMRAVFEKTLYHASNPKDIIFPNYRSGLQAYDWWKSAIEEGTALLFGHSYNAVVWHECRKFAAEFLKEGRKYVTGTTKDTLDEARKHYEVVASNLESITKEYPFTKDLENKPIGTDERTKKTVESLKKAREAESIGLSLLKDLIKDLV